MAGAVLKGLAGLLSRNWGKAAIVGGTGYAFKDEIKEGFSEISENPEKAVETVKNAAGKAGETFDGAKDKVEEAFNYAKDPANAALDKIKKEAEENPDLATAGKWIAGVFGGGLLLKKMFGGGDKGDDNTESSSKGGFPWGMTLLVVAGAVAYLNRDNIMDMVNGNNKDNNMDYMSPDSFEMG